MRKNDLLTPTEIRKMREKISLGIKLQDIIFSNEYLNYFKETAKFITNKNIDIVFNPMASTASTQGTKIIINPFLFENESFSEISVINMGFLAHEVYHILFTDFSVLQKIEFFEGNKKLLKDINNIVEDAAIEFFGGLIYKGDFATSIAFLNNYIINKAKNIEDYPKDINQILCAMSMYGSIQEIKGDISKTIINEKWADIKDIMDKARHELNCCKRFKLSQDIYNIVSSFIDVKKYERRKTSKGDNFESNPDIKIQGLDSDKIEQLQEAIKVNVEEPSKTPSEESSETSSEIQVNLKEEIKGLLEEMERKEEGIKQSEIKERLDSKIEEAKGKKILAISDKINYGKAHKNIKNIIKISKYERETEVYSAIVNENIDIIKSISKKLKKILKTSVPETYRKQKNGRISSRDIASDRLLIDGRVFKKERDGRDLNTCFTIAVDESGSMKIENRDTEAKKAAIIFKEICDNLNIPVCIVGFTASYDFNVVNHQYYCDFDSPKNSKYSLVNIIAKRDNRDGYSIRFLGEVMAKRRPNDRNILIVISDGIPLHNSYKGNYAIKDTKEQIDYLEKKFKTYVIALNISGEDRHRLMYKHVMNIPNVNDLSDALISVLKRKFK